ncbi:MAG TPA: hypothetical protein VFK14_00270 [Solirubrobacterales bacterium]|nr:hypothetical protein [Solirubrobacterales bacterium]
MTKVPRDISATLTALDRLPNPLPYIPPWLRLDPGASRPLRSGPSHVIAVINGRTFESTCR